MAKAKLKFGNVEDYDPQALKKYSEKELRREYTRLRDIAQKRLERFKGSEFESSEVYQAHRKGFKELSQIKGRTDARREANLRAELSELARFVESKRGTVSGQKAIRTQAIRSYREAGYTWVNKGNYNEFIEYLKEAKNEFFGKSPTPEQLETYMIAKQKGISSKDLNKDFEFWMEHRQELKKVELPENRKTTSANYRKALKGLK